MLILQILLPNVSLLGHLAGLLCGTVYSVGGCAYFVPSRDRTVRVDAMLSERMPNYCKIPESSGVDEYARIGVDMLAVRRVCSSIGGGALASKNKHRGQGSNELRFEECSSLARVWRTRFRGGSRRMKRLSP